MRGMTIIAILFWLLYLALSAANIAGLRREGDVSRLHRRTKRREGDVSRLHRRTKPLLCPVLLAAYLCTASAAGASVIWLIPAGLLGGFLGDTFLLNAERYFLPGLSSFLLGHLCYTAAFLMSPSSSPDLPAIFSIFSSPHGRYFVPQSGNCASAAAYTWPSFSS